MRGSRKARINEVVEFRGQTGVVVDYRKDTKWGRYLVIRTDPIGRHPFGQEIWVDATELTGMGLFSKRPGIVYRGNERLGGAQMRGCVCQCCSHVKGWESEPD